MSKQRCLLATTFALFLSTCPVAAEAQHGPNPEIDALRFAIDRQLTYTLERRDAKDYKSLAQAADGSKLLMQLLLCRSDDTEWQAAHSRAANALGALQAAARKEDHSQVEAVMQDVTTQWAAARIPAVGKPLGPPRASSLRQVMLLLEGLQGQAKVALLTGEPANAKRMASVLAQLGPVVSNARRDDAWAIMAHDFTQAAATAAKSSAEEPAGLKPLFRQISHACEACHDSR